MSRLVPDWVWAVMTIMQEAANQPFSTKLAVAEVIFRRTKKKYMSDGSVAGTVLWPLQFSGWNAIDDTPKYRERIECAKINADDPVVKDCLRAWYEAERGSDKSCGATHYANLSICNPSWAADMEVSAVIGHHTFFKEGK